MNKILLDTLWENAIQKDILFGFCGPHSVHLEIEYKSDFRNAIFLREIADTICTNYWVHPKWRTRIVLIVDELNNNAIEYGSAFWDMNLFEFLLQKKESWEINIKIAVTDRGTGPKSKNAQQMEELRIQHTSKDFREHHSIRWRGLFLIISKLVDSLKFENIRGKWLCVIVTKHLREHSEN